MEYYEAIVRRMPGPVLRRHDVVERDGHAYRLTREFGDISPGDAADLVRLCDEAIAEYEAKRGRAIWEHRATGLGQVPGKDRYETFKRARFRCELCGVSAEAEERALDVDHILPRRHSGTDSPENLQALCWLCNTNKGAGDATDFRAIRDSYAQRQAGSLFCHIEEPQVVGSNSLGFAIRDGFPVTPHHTLVLPRRHVAGWFDLYRPERAAVERLLDDQRSALQSLDSSIAGFNIGINAGEAAGQTIFHCHVHLIPRRTGDVENPRGGVRHVIPGRGVY